MSELLRLLRLFAPASGWLLLGLVFTLLTLLTQLLTLGFAGSALILGAGSLAAFALKLSGAVRPVVRYAERLITHSATFRVLTRLRLWLFGRLVPLAPHYLGTQRSGDLLSRLLNDVDALDGFVLRFLLPLLVGLTALGLIIFLLILSAPLLAATALIFIIITALCILLTLRRHYTSLTTVPDRLSDLRQHILDGCEGLSDLLAADAAHLQLHKITLASANYSRAQLGQARVRILIQLFTALCCGAILILAGLIAASWTPPASYLIGPIGLVLIMFALLEAIPALGQALAQWLPLRAAAQRIFSLADTPAPLIEPKQPRTIPADLTLSFTDTSFSYTPTHPVVSGINLTIRPGERVVIEGASGAGKSTLLQGLLKFLTPSEGQILVGGTDLAELDGNAWRRNIAFLSQTTALLAASVRENLLLANPQHDDAALWRALETAELATFVRALPEGLDTWVGEGGASFSGGQARRLAFAQMLLKDAPIWLLDEPTEGLDDTTAGALMTSLAASAAGKTLILITHQAQLAVGLAPSRLIKLKGGKIQN